MMCTYATVVVCFITKAVLNTELVQQTFSAEALPQIRAAPDESATEA